MLIKTITVHGQIENERGDWVASDRAIPVDQVADVADVNDICSLLSDLAPSLNILIPALIALIQHKATKTPITPAP